MILNFARISDPGSFFFMPFFPSSVVWNRHPYITISQARKIMQKQLDLGRGRPGYGNRAGTYSSWGND